MSTYDEVADSWLYGKSIKEKERSPYQEYMVALANFKSGKSELPEMENIRDCLRYYLDTEEPIPPVLAYHLLNDVELLISGREGYLLKKRDEMFRKPAIDDCKRAAVAYVKTCERDGYDEKPRLTVREKFEIGRTTLHNWEKEFSDARDDVEKDVLEELLHKSSIMYSVFRVL